MFDRFKKTKTYKFNQLGYVQMLYDIRQERMTKVSNTATFILILSLFGFGLMSKEFFALYIAGKVIDFGTDIIIR